MSGFKFNEHVHIAVTTKIASQDGSEKRKFRYVIAFAELVDFFLVNPNRVIHVFPFPRLFGAIILNVFSQEDFTAQRVKFGGYCIKLRQQLLVPPTTLGSWIKLETVITPLMVKL